jgi:hypothetical protein
VELGHKSEAEQDMALDEPRGGSRLLMEGFELALK